MSAADRSFSPSERHEAASRRLEERQREMVGMNGSHPMPPPAMTPDVLEELAELEREDEEALVELLGGSAVAQRPPDTILPS